MKIQNSSTNCSIGKENSDALQTFTTHLLRRLLTFFDKRGSAYRHYYSSPLVGPERQSSRISNRDSGMCSEMRSEMYPADVSKSVNAHPQLLNRTLHPTICITDPLLSCKICSVNYSLLEHVARTFRGLVIDYGCRNESQQAKIADL